jgi:hypothetical protein
MMDTYVTTEVNEGIAGKDTPAWHILLLKPDGTLHGHVMPKHTLVARSIEYGIDDEEVLWDIAIHEPFMVHPYDQMYLAKYGPDPAVALGLGGVTCHTGLTIADGRAAHLARLDHCKKTIVSVEDVLALRRPILDHREPLRVHATIEDGFRAARKEVRNARRH